MPRTQRLQGRSVRGLIKRIQRGTIVIAAGAVSATATILGCDPNNSLIFHLGFTNDAATSLLYNDAGSVTITSATVVTATRSAGTGTGNLTISYEVREYWPGVWRSIQRGAVGAAGTFTLSPVVDPSQASIDLIGVGMTTGGGTDDFYGYVKLVDGATVSITHAAASGLVASVFFQVADPA